jgi:flavin reductase (DIM6/NTAB) family NADH-FMN oxidoreductase RutF
MPEGQTVPVTTESVLELLPPFPIVLVTTQTNIITIGQLEYFTFEPLRLGIAIAHSRHTHGLLDTEREFVVNVPDAHMVDAVRLCGSISGRDQDKFDAAGLVREPSSVVRAVSIARCRAKIECKVDKTVDFEERTWFIGPVVAARTDEGFSGRDALLCDRSGYVLPGAEVAPR